MKKTIKRVVNKIITRRLAKKKRIVLDVTDKRKVCQLIERLHPHQTQFDLIRWGPNGDGGYLIPNHLQGIEACFSPGIASVSEFELDCLKHGMKVYMADKSIEKPNLNIPETEYNFLKKFIGCTNNKDFITMDRWVHQNCPSEDSDLLLQMDIEGGEYNSIINMSDSLMNRFRIMVIEFHSLEQFWNPLFFNFVETVFNKILQTHICVHIHPNNDGGISSQFGVEIPRAAEFTFLRKDHAKIKNHTTNFPHKFDFDNTSKKSITLPKNWYRKTPKIVSFDA